MNIKLPSYSHTLPSWTDLQILVNPFYLAHPIRSLHRVRWFITTSGSFWFQRYCPPLHTYNVHFFQIHGSVCEYIKTVANRMGSFCLPNYPCYSVDFSIIIYHAVNLCVICISGDFRIKSRLGIKLASLCLSALLWKTELQRASLDYDFLLALFFKTITWRF